MAVARQPRSARLKRNQERLIQAFLRCIAQGRSFDSIGLREIAREADMPATSFYRYFADMAELTESATIHFVEEIQIGVRQARNALTLEPDLVFKETSRSLLRHVNKNRAAYQLVMAARHSRNSGVASGVHNVIKEIVGDLERDLRRWSENHGLPLYRVDVLSESLVDNALRAIERALESPNRSHLDLTLDRLTEADWMLFSGAVCLGRRHRKVNARAKSGKARDERTEPRPAEKTATQRPEPRGAS